MNHIIKISIKAPFSCLKPYWEREKASIVDECSMVKMSEHFTLLTSSPNNNQMKNDKNETK